MGDLNADLQPVRLSILVDRSALGGRGRGIFFAQGDTVSATDVNEMARSGRGLIAAALTADRALALGIAPLAKARNDSGTRFLTSVEAVQCTETGISAAERALTLRTLASAGSTPADLVSPGHIMPAIVSIRVDPASSLQELAFHAVHASSGALSIAWCDILDDAGDVASAAHCELLAGRLGVPLLVRRGESVIDAGLLDRSSADPVLPVGEGGLDFGQFA